MWLVTTVAAAAVDDGGGVVARQLQLACASATDPLARSSNLTPVSGCASSSTSSPSRQAKWVHDVADAVADGGGAAAGVRDNPVRCRHPDMTDKAGNSVAGDV